MGTAVTVYVTSDTHFNHRSIIDYCNRPFNDVREMNEKMIERWNGTVGRRDEVWHLGDFAYAPGPDGMPLDKLFAALNGSKHLVIGNHDERNPRVLRLPWASIQHYRKFRMDGRRFILCHYPFETWDGSFKGVTHLHGHCHGTLTRSVPGRFDVGVDALPDANYAPQPIDSFPPVSLEVLQERWRNEPRDHHDMR